MLSSTLASPKSQLHRQLAHKSWLGTLGPDCPLMPKIGHIQKTEVAFTGINEKFWEDDVFESFGKISRLKAYEP